MTATPSPVDNFGAHMSIAGGLPNALRRGRAVGCCVVQLFLKSQLQWGTRPLALAEAREFRRQQVETRIHTVFAHGTYLINLASPDESQWRQSVDACADELARAELLGLPFVVIHPGSHRGTGPETGLARIAEAIDELCVRTAGYKVRIALENTAGAGSMLGARAEELGAILRRVRVPERLAICLDTCHLFVAGYDIRRASGLAATLERFDQSVGLGQLVAIHVNDAKNGLGSHVDRHEHLGRGQIGLEAFRCLVRHPRVGQLPMCLETPRADVWDKRNLRTLRRLRRGAPQGHAPKGFGSPVSRRF